MFRSVYLLIIGAVSFIVGFFGSYALTIYLLSIGMSKVAAFTIAFSTMGFVGFVSGIGAGKLMKKALNFFSSTAQEQPIPSGA